MEQKKKSSDKKVRFGEPVIIDVDDASSTVPEHKSRSSRRSGEQAERKHKEPKYDESGERIKEKKSKKSKKERPEHMDYDALNDLELKMASTIAELE